MLMVLAAARFAHFAAACLLFGLAAFPGPTPSARTSTLCAVLALLSGVLVLGAMVANMGGAPEAVLDPQIVAAAVTDTAFGRVWLWRLGLGLGMVAVAVVPRLRTALLLPVSGLFLASIALTGHSGLPGGWLGWLHGGADALHLLAAGWWIGGLAALAMHDLDARMLQRFSRVGYAAVAAIVASGLGKSAILLGTLPALWTSDYGRVLLVKLGLFAGMGLLALSNRFQITPALQRGDDAPRWMRRLRRQVAAELALGLGVLAVVGLLGALSPPISQ
jgi:copper resistance protein D